MEKKRGEQCQERMESEVGPTSKKIRELNIGPPRHGGGGGGSHQGDGRGGERMWTEHGATHGPIIVIYLWLQPAGN